MAAIRASDIKTVAVYPPLGVARVGNADRSDDYMLAAETIGGGPDTRGGFRDNLGRIKRQGVLFRVYAHLQDGSVVELTEDVGAKIEWRVNVANLKGGWYEFNQAMDLPDGISKPASKRNASIADRASLDIVPSARSITGRSQSGQAFNDGKFRGVAVYLGELRTDTAGRLLFLGGRGLSASADGSAPKTFANNDNWHDDTCDGPVRAKVTIDGQTFEAEPGHIAVTPPNFAPGLFGVVTMDDVVRDLFIHEGMLPAPTATSFTRDVWPIFDRMTGLGWVNHGLFVAHGMGSPLHARDPVVVQHLANGTQANDAWRGRVLDLFLTPDRQGPADHTRMPQVFGDAYGESQGFRWKLERLAVTPTMFSHLKRWRDGTFASDWPGQPPLPPAFASLSPSQQVEHLTRVGLHECLGGPFHPGIELTWTMRRRSMWKAPYRLKQIAEDQPTPQDFGNVLTPAVCLSANGPISAAGPGVLTRWMGVPWQTDEASCNSEGDYAPSLYLSMPTFWGARVPDQVLSEQAWSRVVATDASDAQRLKHFSFRDDWLRDVRRRGYLERIAAMVVDWWRLGMVTPRPTTPSEQALGLPDEVFVEGERHPAAAGSNEKMKFIAHLEKLAGAAAIAAGAAVPQEPPRPPRHTYGRGEV